MYSNLYSTILTCSIVRNEKLINGCSNAVKIDSVDANKVINKIFPIKNTTLQSCEQDTFIHSVINL